MAEDAEHSPCLVLLVVPEDAGMGRRSPLSSQHCLLRSKSRAHRSPC